MRIGVEGMPWKPGIQPTRRQPGLSDGLRTWTIDCAMKKIPVGATAFGSIKEAIRRRQNANPGLYWLVVCN